MEVKMNEKENRNENKLLETQKEGYVGLTLQGLKEEGLKEEKLTTIKGYKTKIEQMFGNTRVIGFVGRKDTGKTNNIISALKEFREYNKETAIYFYGLDDFTTFWVKKNISNSEEISSLGHLAGKKDSLIILDEIQKLNLTDRRYKPLLDDFIDFIYHSNNWAILCSPNLREFNSMIGGVIERWIIKSLSEDELVNGSQLKEAIGKYAGRYKRLKFVNISQNEALALNNDFERIIPFDYLPEIDTKVTNKSIFCLENCPENCPKNCPENCPKNYSKNVSENCQKIVQEIVQEIV